MNRKNPNDLSQLIATIGVVIGLVLVLLEIRENNAIALQQAVSTNWTNWNEVYIAEMQPEFASAYAKAMENVDELTLAEKVIVNAWLFAVTGAYHQDVIALDSRGTQDDVDYILQALAKDVSVYFGNQFSRSWYWENRHWMRPEIVEVIERELESVPIGADRDHFERLGTDRRSIPGSN